MNKPYLNFITTVLLLLTCNIHAEEVGDLITRLLSGVKIDDFSKDIGNATFDKIDHEITVDGRSVKIEEAMLIYSQKEPLNKEVGDKYLVPFFNSFLRKSGDTAFRRLAIDPSGNHANLLFKTAGEQGNQYFLKAFLKSVEQRAKDQGGESSAQKSYLNKQMTTIFSQQDALGNNLLTFHLMHKQSFESKNKAMKNEEFKDLIKLLIENCPIEQLLEKNFFGSGQSALHLAIKMGLDDITTLILAKMFHRDNHEYLMRAKSSLNSSDLSLETPLLAAILRGDAETFSRMMNFYNEGFLPSLDHPVFSSYIEAIKLKNQEAVLRGENPPFSAGFLERFDRSDARSDVCMAEEVNKDSGVRRLLELMRRNDFIHEQSGRKQLLDKWNKKQFDWFKDNFLPANVRNLGDSDIKNWIAAGRTPIIPPHQLDALIKLAEEGDVRLSEWVESPQFLGLYDDEDNRGRTKVVNKHLAERGGFRTYPLLLASFSNYPVRDNVEDSYIGDKLEYDRRQKEGLESVMSIIDQLKGYNFLYIPFTLYLNSRPYGVYIKVDMRKRSYLLVDKVGALRSSTEIKAKVIEQAVLLLKKIPPVGTDFSHDQDIHGSSALPATARKEDELLMAETLLMEDQSHPEDEIIVSPTTLPAQNQVAAQLAYQQLFTAHLLLNSTGIANPRVIIKAKPENDESEAPPVTERQKTEDKRLRRWSTRGGVGAL